MTTLRQTIKDLPIGPEHAMTIPTSKIATVRSTASQLRLKISLKITVNGETATVEKVGQGIPAHIVVGYNFKEPQEGGHDGCADKLKAGNYLDTPVTPCDN